MGGVAAQGKGDGMTRSAWLMLAATWFVIIFFTAKFFVKVLRTPQREEDG